MIIQNVKHLANFKSESLNTIRRRPKQVIGKICVDHMRKSIENIMGQCLGTTLWVLVLDLNSKFLYHSYDADQEGYKAAMGWELYYEQNILNSLTTLGGILLIVGKIFTQQTNGDNEYITFDLILY